MDASGNKFKAKQCFGPLCNGIYRSLESFHKNKKGLGGRKEKCIECVRYDRGTKKRNDNILIEKYIDGKKVTLKSCTVCGEFKELNQYSNAKGQLYNKYPSCKSCENKRLKDYYKDNKAKVNEKGKKYYQENREIDFRKI
ncbi:hypothetical protein FHP05_00185 [Cerasibacillus terrae]|uniref:Uncharacterized protein n=1 Tax=Cerasibacillus terrae TaxID=2498845 RepID=A0A5C8P2N8_9BACI|nr:hypothetical protein [Cerasibacillus terrae]TXL67476.1 hypothetical protein FHP05_00185 [Cerasibacillus terrae]